MTERLYGISYAFSPMPDTDVISTEGAVPYSPTVVCYGEGEDRPSILQFPGEFRAYPRDDTLYTGSKSYYNKLRTIARDNQERLIADFICARILEQLRRYPADRLVFVIKDAFETEKFVGRLGYLGLPLDRISIYFVSSNLKDFLTNYLEPYSEGKISDLARLKGESDKLFGPFPQDEEMTMLRTYFWTFANPELYPLRINLFSQFMNHAMLEREGKRIEGYFKTSAWTEVYRAEGGRGIERTRLPTVLIQCEEYIKNKLAGSER